MWKPPMSKQEKIKQKKEKEKNKVLDIPRTKKSSFSMGEIPFKHSDLKRIRRLLFIGIVLRLKKKSEIKWKVWVWGFSHIWVISRTPVSCYRKMFKLLKQKGIYLK